MTKQEVKAELRRSLADLMSDLSEDQWAAGWFNMPGHEVEVALWEMVTGKRKRDDWGMGEVSLEDVERLRRLAEHLGEWYDGKSFVPLTDEQLAEIP